MADASKQGWMRPVALGVAGAAAVALAIAISRCATAPADTVHAIGNTSVELVKAGERVAEKFMTAHIETTWREYLATASPTGLLDVATLEQTEELGRSDERRVLWDQISLGRTTTAVKITATFRYHVPLEREKWKAEVRDHTLVVVAPPLRPTLPVAFRSDQVEERSERGWARWNVAEQMDGLRRSITPALDARAGDREHLQAAREPARRAIGEFSKSWLLREKAWGGESFSAVAVRFEDEVAGKEPVVVREGG